MFLFSWLPDLLGLDKDNPIRHVVGIIGGGLVGYGAYYLASRAMSSGGGSGQPRVASGSGGSEQGQVGVSQGRAIYRTSQGYVRADGVKVRWDGAKWVPISTVTGIKIDPTFTKGVDTNQPSTSTASREYGEDAYQAAYSSFNKGKEAGLNLIQAVANSRWTKKITTPDGIVIWRDAEGFSSVKGEDGGWHLIDPNGKYVSTTTATTTNYQVSKL